jgi:hypothetical protein
VARKLAIMTLTPMVALTATVSAATATPVRLTARATVPVASRPSTPKRAEAGRLSVPIRATVKAGAVRAMPMTTQKRLPKLAVSECSNATSATPPKAAIRRPAPVTPGRRRRVAVSSVLGLIVVVGSAPAASRAGLSAESTPAPRPRRTPFATDRAVTGAPVTEST